MIEHIEQSLGGLLGQDESRAKPRLAAIPRLSGTVSGSQLSRQGAWSERPALFFAGSHNSSTSMTLTSGSFYDIQTSASSLGELQHVSQTNASLLAFLERWSREPDDKGPEWWAEFEEDLERLRGFEERDV